MKKACPFGNYTSQYFANIYMNELDKYIKEQLKIKYYVRFMDDGLLIVKNKNEAKKVMEQIKKFTNEKLKLEFNRKSQYFPAKKGVIFCGYRIYNNKFLIKRANIIRVKRRIRGWNKEWKKGITRFEYWTQSFNSWKGYAKFANANKLIDKLEKRREFIYREEISK